jgi:hypothetical protein
LLNIPWASIFLVSKFLHGIEQGLNGGHIKNRLYLHT